METYPNQHHPYEPGEIHMSMNIERSDMLGVLRAGCNKLPMSRKGAKVRDMLTTVQDRSKTLANNGNCVRAIVITADTAIGRMMGKPYLYHGQ